MGASLNEIREKLSGGVRVDLKWKLRTEGQLIVQRAKRRKVDGIKYVKEILRGHPALSVVAID